MTAIEFHPRSLRGISSLGFAVVLLGLGAPWANGQGVAGETDLLRRMSAIDPFKGRPHVQTVADASSATPERPEGATEITASEEVTFEQAENKAVFVGNVVVRDPQFTLTAKKLTAYLKNGKKAEAPMPKDSPAAKAAGGLDKAIAEGDVVIVQIKKDADGNPKRYEGRGQKVVYVAATDEITLTGSPQVREGINLHVATDPSTVMVLTSSGKLRTTGASKTIIASSKDE